jgi:predicted DNA-binding ribbon-helix-helix protein
MTRAINASSAVGLDAGAGAMKSQVVKRSIVVAGHKTSVSLEDDFWKGLKEIARSRDMTLSDLVAAIDAGRHHGNLSSAIRLHVLRFYREQIAEDEQRNRTRELLSGATIPKQGS